MRQVMTSLYISTHIYIIRKNKVVIVLKCSTMQHFYLLETKLSQAYHIDLKKMYVDCLLYANKYYDLIIIFMRFIIFFYFIFFCFVGTILLTFRSCLFPQAIDLSMILNFNQAISFFVICLKKYN